MYFIFPIKSILYTLIIVSNTFLILSAFNYDLLHIDVYVLLYIYLCNILIGWYFFANKFIFDPKPGNIVDTGINLTIKIRKQVEKN